MFSNNSFRSSFASVKTLSYTPTQVLYMKGTYGSTYTFVIRDQDIAWGLGFLAFYSMFNNKFGKACVRIVYELILLYVLTNIVYEFVKLYNPYHLV